MEMRALSQSLYKSVSARAGFQFTIDGDANRSVAQHSIAQHLQNPVPLVCTRRIHALEDAVVLRSAVLFLAAVPGYAERVEAVSKRPRCSVHRKRQ